MISMRSFYWSWVKSAILIILATAIALAFWLNVRASALNEVGTSIETSATLQIQEEEFQGGIPCTLGFAGPFPCHNVDLLAYIPLNVLVAGTAADIWGWTDPETDREYSILSHSSATSFVDVTDPINPVILGHLPSPVLNILWRDVKVYNNHAYIVGDGNIGQPHGLQVFDLTQLPDVSLPPQVFSQTARYTLFGRAHNIAINEETGFAYVVGSNTCAGGLHMIDLSDPVNPTFAGCFSQDGYTHDVQCVIYRGLDDKYIGNEICFASNENTLTIVDVTDKSAPVMLSRTTYQGVGYTHQGWLTEDHAFFVLGDELDELNNGHNTHTYLWDLTDLDAPVHFSTYVGPTPSIDHNLFIRGNFVYQSNYTSGLRILDTREIPDGILTEVAFFDTHPASDAPVFAGTWSNYPFFESGIVIVSNIEDGLYVLRPHLPVMIDARANGGGWLEGNSGKKINFGFEVEQTDGDGVSGSLQLNDREAGVKVEITRITSLNQGSGCESQTRGEAVLEIFGEGAFNGDNASFRACVADNGNPGKGQDQFFLECTGGCTYDTASSAPDNVLDGGNIQVHLDAASDPLLLTEGLVGQVQLFSVTVYDQNGERLPDAQVTLSRTNADGSVESLIALSDLTGAALFSLVNLDQVSEYIATAGSTESNAIQVSPVWTLR